MSEPNQRPGGLIALAVINFVFAALGLLGMLGMAFLVFMGDQMAQQVDGEDGEEIRRLVEEFGGFLKLMILLGLASTALLVISGIGYLRLKRVAGRYCGNAYAVLALAATGAGMAMMPEDVGLIDLIGLVYPVLTLILINTVFRHDLVR